MCKMYITDFLVEIRKKITLLTHMYSEGVIGRIWANWKWGPKRQTPAISEQRSSYCSDRYYNRQMYKKNLSRQAAVILTLLVHHTCSMHCMWSAQKEKYNSKRTVMNHRQHHSQRRAVTKQHSSSVLAHHEHKILNSKSIRKVMLLPYNTLKQSEYNTIQAH